MIFLGGRCKICGKPAVSKTFLRNGDLFYRCEDHLDISPEEYERGEFISRYSQWKERLIDEFTQLLMRDDNNEHSVKSLLKEFAYRLETRLRSEG